MRHRKHITGIQLVSGPVLSRLKQEPSPSVALANMLRSFSKAARQLQGDLIRAYSTGSNVTATLFPGGPQPLEATRMPALRSAMEAATRSNVRLVLLCQAEPQAKLPLLPTALEWSAAVRTVTVACLRIISACMNTHACRAVKCL